MSSIEMREREQGHVLNMGRALRIECPGALYHVTSRGNERKDIFLGEGRPLANQPEFRNDRNSNAFQNLCEIRDQYPSKKCHFPIYLWTSPFLGTSGHFWQANINFYYFSSLVIADISSRIFSKFSSSLPYSAQFPWRNQSLALL